MISLAAAPLTFTHGRFWRSNTECRLRRQIPVWMHRLESQKTVRSPFSYVRSAMPRSDLFEDDDGDLAAGLLRVLGEAGHELLLAGPDPVTLLALSDPGALLDGVRADLDGHHRVGLEVVEPVGVGVGAALGSEDGDVVAHWLVRHRVDPLLAGLGAARVEEEHVRAFERSSEFALVGAELVDDLGIPVVRFTHGVSDLIASTTILADRPPATGGGPRRRRA